MKLDITQGAHKTKTLAAPGVYDFNVISAKDDTTKTGKDMIVLTLEAKDASGKTYEVKDWLFDWSHQKIADFCWATGRGQIRGEVRASDLATGRGRCVVGVKPANGNYPASNEIKSYLPATRPQTAQSPSVAKKMAPLDFEDTV